MRIAQIMSRNPTCVGIDDTIAHIKAIMESKGFHHLLVVDDGELVGIVSDRDFLKTISKNVGTNSSTLSLARTLGLKVGQIATMKPTTLGPDADLTEAIEVFRKFRFSAIPIVDNQNAPVGILSMRDVIGHVIPEDAA